MNRNSPSASPQSRKTPEILVCFSSQLGWMAMIGSGPLLKQLTIGHPTPRDAEAALNAELLEDSRPGEWNEELVGKLTAYAAGEIIDFADVELDLAPLSDFQRRVVRACREIPYGRTRSYGQLAAAAGSPKAARAVGNCMAANRFPLIVPCHRVLLADGRLGAFSAPGGTGLKQRLLALEASHAIE